MTSSLKGCSLFAISKVPRKLPEGKLTSFYPYQSHDDLGHTSESISCRKSVDLPSSDSNTCVLVVVDCFLKACKLIPLKGLLKALKTAETIFQHIFCHFGIPEDIVSDRSPQFNSRVWHAFFQLLRVTVSLSSGYHPQSNGQT